MTDLTVIQKLERVLDRKLFQKPFDKSKLRYKKAYCVNEVGHVIHIGLPHCSLQSLDPIVVSLKELPHLQSLDLSYNQISDLSFLRELTQLQSLNLRSNQVSDVSFLQELRQLQSLDLSYNQIIDYSFLRELRQLQSLSLGDNAIGDCSFLRELRQLQSLDLSSNQISDISFLIELTQLQSLDLGSNRVSEFSFLRGLKQLQSLDLGSNQIDNYSFLTGLTQLRSLDLSYNQINDYSFMRGLKQLQSLDLGSSQIDDFSFLQGLTQLQCLYLSDNYAGDDLSFEELTQLQSLDLSSNWISDVTFLRELTQLEILDLSDNGIEEISLLRELTQLKSLYLAANQINDFSFIQELTQLQNLDLSSNHINDISFLQELTQLQSLDLSSNQIKDISVLAQLPSLEEVLLYDNQIMKLPSWVTELDLTLTASVFPYHGEISVGENPIEMPPLEIVKQGKQAIRDYFRSLEGQQTIKLNEVKLLLVGEGMSGKTSLLKQLQGLPFDAQESQTHGINVVTLPANQIKGLEENEALHDCQLHCWDFGGQEIMHASHQFFLSERALYILVIDSRTDDKKYHWLKHIEKFGGDSPLIVVMNKIDVNHNYNIEQNRINESFPMIQNRFVRLSCETREGLSALIKYIGDAIPQTSLFGTEISVTWMNVKDALVTETTAKRYISRDRFIAICQENGVVDESSQQTLLKYLHDLGIVLYFEQLSLANIYVLDPHWVTIGVYKIINSERVTNGLLIESDLGYILNEEEVKKKEYDPAREKTISYDLDAQRYLLEIMMQFELCYEYDKQRRLYIVPNLLPKEIDPEPMLNQSNSLRFVMDYDFLPTSIIARVMLHFKNDIENDRQWRYGMVLYNQQYQCRAKIKSYEEQKRITIVVEGEEHRKREYFSVIRHKILDISSEFENLEIKELIPLPGYPDSYVEYQDLLGFEHDGRDEYFDGKLRQSFSVSKLLDSVISQAERIRESQYIIEGNYYAGGHHEGDATTVGDIFDSEGIAVGRKNRAVVRKRTQTPLPIAPLPNEPLQLSAAEKQEVNKLREQKGAIEAPIQKRARFIKIIYMLGILGLIVLVSVLLNALVQQLGWDTLEPYTWIVGILMVVAAPLFAKYSPEKFSPAAIEKKYFVHQSGQSLRKYGFDRARFEELSQRQDE